MEEQVISFLENDVGNVVVNNVSGAFLHIPDNLKFSEKAKKNWFKNIPLAYEAQRSDIWELYDPENHKYYRITTSSVRSGKELIQLSFLLDITEYTSILKTFPGFLLIGKEHLNFRHHL